MQQRVRQRDRAFTLVELSVSMIVALVVWSVVAFVVQTLTLQPARLNQRVQAREIAGHMMQKLVQEFSAARRIVQIVDMPFPGTPDPQVQRITFALPDELTGRPAGAGASSCHAFGSVVAEDPNDPSGCLDPPPEGLTQYVQMHQYGWQDTINAEDPLAFEFVTGGPTPATPNSAYSGQIHELLPHCHFQLHYVVQVSYLAPQGPDWVPVTCRVYTGDPDPVPCDGTASARDWLDSLFDSTFEPAPPIKDLQVRLETVHIRLIVHHESEQAMLQNTALCSERPLVNRYYNRIPPA